MPYSSEWVAPEVACTSRGIKIYHTYKDDEIDQGRQDYWYTIEEDGCEDSAFDVRDLPNYEEHPHPPYLCGADNTPENEAAWKAYHAAGGEEKHIKKILRQAVRLGYITEDEVTTQAELDAQNLKQAAFAGVS